MKSMPLFKVTGANGITAEQAGAPVPVLNYSHFQVFVPSVFD